MFIHFEVKKRTQAEAKTETTTKRQNAPLRTDQRPVKHGETTEQTSSTTESRLKFSDEIQQQTMHSKNNIRPSTITTQRTIGQSNSLVAMSQISSNVPFVIYCASRYL
jgi:ATPase subunit of ABC transporter with duplicated ATPase domains